MSRPAASSSGKYFWLAFMVRIRHSCGTSRNSRSNSHTSTLGRSTSAVTSSSSASSSIGWAPPPVASAASASWRAISARRASKPAITAPSSSQLHRVGVGVAQHDRVDLGFEAMAMGLAPGLEPQRLDRHDRVAMQRDQAVRRAHEAHAAPARQLAAALELVAHDLGNRQPGDGLGQRLLQAFDQRRALGGAVEVEGLGLAVHRAAQRRHGRGVGAEGRQALVQRGRRAARGIEADAHRHQLLRDRAVGGLGAHAREVRREAARRGVGGEQRAGIGQALGHELVAQHDGEGVAELLRAPWAAVLRRRVRRAGCSVVWVIVSGRLLRRSVRPIRAAPSGSRGARGSRSSSARRCAPGCGCGRCRRRARSR